MRSPKSTPTAPRGRRALALAVMAVFAAAPFMTGCYAPQLALLRSGLDSLRTTVDTLTVRSDVAYRVLEETRQDVHEQRETLLATRATANATQRQTADVLDRLEGKIDDVMAKFRIQSERSGSGSAPATPPATGPSGATGLPGGSPASGGQVPRAAEMFDQATADLTQGRYAMALQGYRDLLRTHPEADLADDAQYGVGECFFAQAAYDSAVVEYARVDARWPKGSKASAALYRMSLCQERLGRTAESRKTLEDLLKRFPNSSEAPLARARLSVEQKR
ncbi:MAG: tetratricopeptide repeat protein [Candidatus Eisenbacteria bacterium]